MSDRLRVVGLCGGIGAGKSTVAALLAERGATVIDVDGIGHDVLTRDDVRDAVVAEFGTEVLATDGTVDRSALAALVFACRTPGSGDRLSDLEAISHPAINRELDRRLGELADGQVGRPVDGPHLVVLDMAVLVALHQDGRGYTEVVAVEADRRVRLERLVDRGMTIADAEARMASQADDAERRAVADHVVANDGDRIELDRAVDLLFDGLTRRGRPAPDRCTPGD